MPTTANPPETGKAARSLADTLADARYVRSRLVPAIRDPHFLILCDVRTLVGEFANRAAGTLLDFGSGGAPYKSLFHRVTRYIAADIAPNPATDQVLNTDGTTGLPDASCDAILSTQVLEHVQEPQQYLRECWRVLRPGGRLLLTTHGMYPEHGCPHDHHRWTAVSFQHEVARAGFEIVASHKLTTGPRAAVQLLHYLVFHGFETHQMPVLQHAFHLLRLSHHWLGVPIWNLVGRSFSSQGLVPGSDSSTLYVGVAIEAIRPAP
jgi:SAM-dependent methyltransferase